MSSVCCERFNGCGKSVKEGRSGSKDGLTLKPSLRTAETGDQAAFSKPVKRGNRLVALVCLVCLVYLVNQTNSMNQTNQIDQTNQRNQMNHKRRGRPARGDNAIREMNGESI